MGRPGRVYSRTEILEAVQGVAFEAYERTVDAHIKNLRQEIEAEPANPDYILTVRGVGYRLNPELADE
jgi:DNA-binding response OmpR family regulator